MTSLSSGRDKLPGASPRAASNSPSVGSSGTSPNASQSKHKTGGKGSSKTTHRPNKPGSTPPSNPTNLSSSNNDASLLPEGATPPPPPSLSKSPRRSLSPQNKSKGSKSGNNRRRDHAGDNMQSTSDEEGKTVGTARKRPRSANSTSGTDAAGSDDVDAGDANTTPPYTILPFHGDHRRAVSAVSFASTAGLMARGRFGGISMNSNEVRNQENLDENQAGDGGGATAGDHVGAVALCASASADGSSKVWEITQQMIETSASSYDKLKSVKKGASKGEPNEPPDRQVDYPLNLSRLLTPRQALIGHNRGINDVCWSPTASYIATASDDKTLRLWDALTGDALVEFRGHTNFVFSCRFNPQSNLLVSGSFDETVKLWDVRCGECVSTLPAHSDPVTGVDFNRDGTCIVSGSHDGLIRVWDTATGECLKTIYAEGNPPVSSVRFSPNGKYVLSGTLDSKLRLWDVAGRLNAISTTQRMWPMDGVPTSTGGMGTYGVSGSLGGCDLDNRPRGGQCSKTYGGHQNTRFCAFATFSAVNPQRPCVVSGSEDGKVYLFDLQSRVVRQTLEGHSDAVLAVDTHDQLELIASGGMSTDKMVRFWAPLRITIPSKKSIKPTSKG